MDQQQTAEAVPKGRDFLISYANHDVSWAEWIGTQVEQAGYSIFLLAWDVRPGNNLILALDQALRTCQRCLLVLSPAYLQEGLTQAQWAAVFRQDPANEYRSLLPVKIEDCQPTGFLATHNPIELSGLEEQEASERLLAFLAAEQHQSGQQLPSEVPRKSFYPGSPVTWNLPYYRNPYFTGQEEYLSELRKHLWEDQRIAVTQTEAISGLGGVGKTQLAVEYAYRYRADYTHVFWVRADTYETIINSYNEIAALLQLPGQAEQDQQLMVAAVKRWLQMHRRYLLILDNADDLAMVQPFLPTACPGHVLVTTRTQHVGRFARRLEIDTLAQEMGALLLLRRAGLIGRHAFLEGGTTEDQALALNLTEELGGLPLALDQAGAYIETTRCSLTDYQQQYRLRREELLALRNGPTALPGEWAEDHPAAVVTTWSLSFQRVEQKNPVAAELLRFCAYLSPDAIPEEIITRGSLHLGPLLAVVGADTAFLDQAIEALRAYSLLNRDPRTHTLSVHRLVQTVLREQMERSGEKEWKQRAALAVASASPRVEDVAQWEMSERWIPHALVCARWMEEEQIVSSATASMLSTAGSYLSLRTRYREAESLYHRALVIREQTPGSEHPDTAEILDQLGTLYASQESPALAEFFSQRALEIREKTLGPEHPATAESLNNLGALYSQNLAGFVLPSLPYILAFLDRMKWLPLAKSLHQRALFSFYPDQEKFARAEQLYQRALAIREQKLGPEHPDTAKSLNNLALFYHSQGKLALAEPLYQCALAIREQKLGPEHPDTAESLHNLALFYHSQGKRETFRKAEPLYQRALAIGEQKLGVGHIFTIPMISNLAFLYMQQGRFEKAEAAWRHILTIYEQYPDQDPSTLKGLRETYSLLQKPALLMKAGRKIWEKLPGQAQSPGTEPFSDHESVVNDELENMKWLDAAQSLNKLGFRYQQQGKYAAAEPFLRYALLANEQKQGLEHPDTLHSQNNLAFLYEQQGKFEKAESLYERVQAVNERTLGLEHPDTLRSMNFLANVYWLQGQHARALAVYDRILALDPQNSLAYTLHGNISYAQRDYARAIADYDQAILLDPGTATLYNNRGNAHRDQGDYAQALADYNQAILLDPNKARTYNDRAKAYARQNDYVHAGADFDQATLLDPHNAAFHYDLAQALYKQGDYAQANSAYSRVISLAPKNARAYNDRAHAYYAQGNYAHAVADYTQAIALDPKSARFYFNRGDSYSHQDDYPHAIADYTQAIALDQKNARFYDARGYMYLFQDDYAHALADFDQALLLDPACFDAYIGRGDAYSRQGDPVRALADISQGFLLNPNEASLYNYRGNIYFEQRDYPHAIADYTQAILLDSGAARYYTNRGNACYAQEDYPHAIADYTQAISLNASDGSLYNIRGNAYRSQGDYARAIADYDLAISLSPQTAIFSSNRGYTYFCQQDYKRAMDDFNQALVLDSSDATTYYRRGHVFSAQQDYTRAIVDYSQALVLDPNDATTYDRRTSVFLAQQDYQLALATLDQTISLDPNNVTANQLRRMFIDKFGL